MTRVEMTRRALTAGALAVPAFMGTPAFSQSDDASALGRAVEALFDPSATSDLRSAFWRDRYSSAGKAQTSLETFDAEMRGVAELTGGVDLLETRYTPEGTRAQTAFLMRPRRGTTERWVRVLPDRDDPQHVFDIASRPLPAIYDRNGPTGPVSRAELALEIERRVRYAAERDDFSGAVLITAPDGEPIWQEAFGLADHQTQRRNTLETPFHLGSSDKSFTALMIGRLIREGKLTFDTRLIDVLPDYPGADFARACTINHLLTHSSGLGGLFERAAYDKQRPHVSMAQLLPAFATEPPAWAPGSQSGYSNEGFIVLGAVIEAISGRSWYDVLAEQIYAPTAMTRSAHFLRDEALDRKARGYTYPETDRLGFGARVRNDDIVGYRGNSCGGGYSTVADMTRYLRALRAGELMPVDQLAQFVVAQPGGLPGYGCGFQVRRAGERTIVGHSGGGPRSGIDGDHFTVWETGWTLSILGNYDSPFTGEMSRDIGRWLALQDG